jgi:hypothetical protein
MPSPPSRAAAGLALGLWCAACVVATASAHDRSDPSSFLTVAPIADVFTNITGAPQSLDYRVGYYTLLDGNNDNPVEVSPWHDIALHPAGEAASAAAAAIEAASAAASATNAPKKKNKKGCSPDSPDSTRPYLVINAARIIHTVVENPSVGPAQVECS